MFINLLPNNFTLFNVVFSDYADRHFRKKFAKNYPGNIWKITEQAIFDELSRIDRDLQNTQQVDELYHSEVYWMFKYDFSVAKSKISPKASGNRAVCFLNSNKNMIEILFLFGIDDLEKKRGEQANIDKILNDEFLDKVKLCHGENK